MAEKRSLKTFLSRNSENTGLGGCGDPYELGNPASQHCLHLTFRPALLYTQETTTNPQRTASPPPSPFTHMNSPGPEYHAAKTHAKSQTTTPDAPQELAKPIYNGGAIFSSECKNILLKRACVFNAAITLRGRELDT